MKNSTSATQLRSLFAVHGLPEMLVTDNRSSFISNEFKISLRDYGIRHVTVPPVQTVKEFLNKLSTEPLCTSVPPASLMYVYYAYLYLVPCGCVGLLHNPIFSSVRGSAPAHCSGISCVWGPAPMIVV